MLDRRKVLKSTAALGITFVAGATVGKRAVAPPALPPGKIEAFVRAAHQDLTQVRQLLADDPGLANATWDWGGGDFETALGGAAHMGQREIALHLLAEGARLDLFAAAMLGRLDVVRAALTIDPQALHVAGPHGIPLVAHARKGGQEAIQVVEYLEGLA